MFKNFARVFAAGAIALAAVLPSTAFAASGSTGAISLSFDPTATVNSKLLITATITTTCPLLLQYQDGPPVIDTNGFAGFVQIKGKTISHAGSQGFLTICDGLPHTSQVTALAYDHPFRSGTGGAQAQVFQLCGFDPVSLTFLCVNGSTSQLIDFVAVR